MTSAGAAVLVLAWLQLNIQFPETAMAHVEQGLRWVHFVAGITWIGLLYFFNLVSVPTMKECGPAMRAEVVTKMMPRALRWFGGSADLTVLVGVLYFIIYMMRDARNAGEPALAWKWLGLWVVVWVVAWAVMYFVLRRLVSGWVVAGAALVVFTGASWIVLSLLAHPEASNRTLSISVGGGIGLVLLMNVHSIVVRSQKKIIAWTKASMEQGTPMPPEAERIARQVFLTSRLGFWLSFPMLFFMAASSHYPFLSGR